MALEVRVGAVRTGAWGVSFGGGIANDLNRRLGAAEGERCVMIWRLDPDALVGRNQYGHTIALRPFMGVMGMPPPEPGIHPTWPPRPWGGNLDCKELVPGSRLFLPVPVPGALFSVGDGHATQGDGEVSGVAVECPMERVELSFHLHDDLRLSAPRAETPEGWLTLGLSQDLNEATWMAVNGMLDLMGELYGLPRNEALALASLVVDLRITQVVNGTRGVHALLPHGAIR
jgi:acetamidase/formamidase